MTDYQFKAIIEMVETIVDLSKDKDEIKRHLKDLRDPDGKKKRIKAQEEE